MSTAATTTATPTATPRTALRRALVVTLLGLVAGLGIVAIRPAGDRAGTDPTRDPGAVTSTTGADGDLPDGVTVFDDRYPGVANLDPDLLRALRAAATDAAAEGVTMHVNSGWRSAAHQARLLREAVSEHGSEEEAARWVATPETSAHVTGDAVDIGPADASAWLARRGAGYGLCPVYRNEPWHYELRPEAIGAGCPALYADPTHDPRMQR